ncbi:cold-shock protein [Streptomyces xiamenensis]|uniref:cold-shock protein n=1 Tax=Streptomyces xiamenensis TaxID=408015 RepID=UPI0036E4D252
MTATGKILRFDEARGYGFIVPDEGDGDVFMHANDLVEEEYLYQAGRRVEYVPEEGDRGPKAGKVRLIRQTPPPAAPTGQRGAPAQRPEQDDDADYDLLTASEFKAEVTEALIEADPSLTTGQLQHVRQRLLRLAEAHGWVESD